MPDLYTSPTKSFRTQEAAHNWLKDNKYVYKSQGKIRSDTERWHFEDETGRAEEAAILIETSSGVRIAFLPPCLFD